jgi:hypothetical protein
MKTAKQQITDDQPKIPEPWLPEHLIEPNGLTKIGNMDLAETLDELASQLGVMNDYYYPLLAAAGKLRIAAS